MESNTHANDGEVLGAETADPTATEKDPQDWVTGDDPAPARRRATSTRWPARPGRPSRPTV